MYSKTLITLAVATLLSTAVPAAADTPFACGPIDFSPIVINKDDDTVRFASFNASLNRNAEGQLIGDLSAPGSAQASAVAEIIQRTRPDVLLINEFDFDADGSAAHLFQANYLRVSQNGAPAIEYRYMYLAPSNTGIPSGLDLNNDGSVGGPNDAFGFGFYPGQFGMLLLSRYPILNHRVRTFQKFRWADMPNALLPDDPSTPEPSDWYSTEELEVFRLSSKSHWDVPIRVGDQVVHVLASHPTPPVFDDPPFTPAGVDFNGRRNHDEIRFWADYVGERRNAQYIVDDNGKRGGLRGRRAFVIMGDQNADPFDGDSTGGAILQLLDHPRIDASVVPGSSGGAAAAARQDGANDAHLGSAFTDTADFADGNPGNLRVDYVLPSTRRLEAGCGGVYWPQPSESAFSLVGEFPFPSSDHRLVWLDVEVDDWDDDDDD